MVGGSVAMRRIYGVLARAAQSNATVLFGGESGTGKELAARAVHDGSPRRDGPFVVFDCGAASETLIESDLFGHVKGAYTGAVGERAGAFAQAHGGTLFLDEIGDLPLSLQPKLLRMLEAGEVTPLGGRRGEKYDVRVVAATHRDLWQEVARGAFRGDLYYRLAVVEVQLPPLRARREDIPELVRRFLDRSGAPQAAAGDLAGPNLDKLVAYGWPGNVREMENAIEHAVVLCDGTTIQAEHLPQSIAATSRPVGAPPPTGIQIPGSPMSEIEREAIMRTIEAVGGSNARAAEILGISVRKIQYRLREWGVQRSRRRAHAPTLASTERPAAG
jgi:two-component system NtrC family response regulator/two-component system response regulator HydG